MKKKVILLCILGAALIGVAMLQHPGSTDSTTTTNSAESSSSSSSSSSTTSSSSSSSSTSSNSNSTTTSINSSMGDNITIKDETFVAQLDEIFLDIDSYVGKTITVEGLVSDAKSDRFSIIRYYDAPHEDHTHEVPVGIIGFADSNIPADETWVKVTGKIEKKHLNDRDEPIIRVQSVEKLETEGQIKVNN